MSILCKLFGHKPLTDSGCGRSTGYAQVAIDTTDGLNTWHLFLKAECPRCREIYNICKVHVPSKVPPGWPTKDSGEGAGS